MHAAPVTSLVVCAIAIVITELWRRRLARARGLPRWITGLAWGLFALALTTSVLSWVFIVRAFDQAALGGVESAIALVEYLDLAEMTNKVGVAALVAAIIVLGIVELRRSRR